MSLSVNTHRTKQKFLFGIGNKDALKYHYYEQKLDYTQKEKGVQAQTWALLLYCLTSNLAPSLIHHGIWSESLDLSFLTHKMVLL